MAELKQAQALTMDEHIFRGSMIATHYLMAECLKDYPGDDPEYAALVEADRARQTTDREDGK